MQKSDINLGMTPIETKVNQKYLTEKDVMMEIEKFMLEKGYNIKYFEMLDVVIISQTSVNKELIIMVKFKYVSIHLTSLELDKEPYFYIGLIKITSDENN